MNKYEKTSEYIKDSWIKAIKKRGAYRSVFNFPAENGVCAFYRSEKAAGGNFRLRLLSSVLFKFVNGIRDIGYMIAHTL